MSQRLLALSSALLPVFTLLAACSSNSIGAPPVLSRTIAEPVGVNCSQGGQRIESGADNNRDGVLNSGEVNSISYLCAGMADISVKVIGGTEASGITQLQFNLTEAVDAVASFDYSSADGAPLSATAGVDYQAASGNVSFAAGETSKTVSFTLLDDALLEGGETFSVNFTNPVNAVLATTQVAALIVDDELNTVNLSQTELKTLEADTEVLTLSINLSESQNLAISQGFELAGTATLGQDYTVSANTFELGAGETTASIDLTVLNDALAEGSETIELTLSESGNGVLGDNKTLNIEINAALSKLYSGSRHACALSDDNALKCWGYNNRGQLGLLDSSSRGDNADEMGVNLPLVELGNFPIAELALGNLHSCALSSSGQVKCWGNNAAGQLGRDDIQTIGSSTVPNPNYDPAAAEDNAASDSCDEINNSTLPGQCLFGDKLAAINLGTGVTVTQLAAGFEHNCALLSDNSVKCWGLNNYGQLGLDSQESIGNGLVPNPNYDATNGNGDNDDSCLHTNVPQLPVTCGNVVDTEMGNNLAAISLAAGNVTQLVSGAYHTCAVIGLNTLQCWGLNASGQLGLGDNNNRGDGLIVNANFEPTGSDPDDVAICDSVTEQFIPLSCDNNISTEMDSELDSINFGQNIVELSAGVAHTCVRLQDQSVKCWGSNGSGQLGLGNTDSVGRTQMVGAATEPALLGAGLMVTALATGGAHNCAQLSDDSVKCWGSNNNGQLGLGDNDNRGISAETSGDMLNGLNLVNNISVVDLSLGQLFSCALALEDAQQQVYCWGDGLFGQLGLGSNSDQNELNTVPVAIF